MAELYAAREMAFVAVPVRPTKLEDSIVYLMGCSASFPEDVRIHSAVVAVSGKALKVHFTKLRFGVPTPLINDKGRYRQDRTSRIPRIVTSQMPVSGPPRGDNNKRFKSLTRRLSYCQVNRPYFESGQITRRRI